MLSEQPKVILGDDREEESRDNMKSSVSSWSILRGLRKMECRKAEKDINQVEKYHSSNLVFHRAMTAFDSTDILSHEYQTNSEALFKPSDIAAAMHLNSYNNSAPVTLYLGNFSERKGEKGTLVVACPKYMNRNASLAAIGTKKAGKLVTLCRDGYTFIKPKPDNPLAMSFNALQTASKNRRLSPPLEYAPRQRLVTADTAIRMQDVPVDSSMTGRAFTAQYMDIWMSRSCRKLMVKDIIEACQSKGIVLSAEHVEQLRMVYFEAECQAENCVVTSTRVAGLCKEVRRGPVVLVPHMFEWDKILSSVLDLEQVLISAEIISSYLDKTRDPRQKKVVGTVVGERYEKISNENLYVLWKCMLCTLRHYNYENNPSQVSARAVDQSRLSEACKDSRGWWAKNNTEGSNLATIDLIPPVSVRIEGLPLTCYHQGPFVAYESASTCTYVPHMYNILAVASMCKFD